ncbi:MAG: GIY-YIG nuclease family protein [Gammaproteobacteria bacterium HGW-Gammaproteobacteria-4]|jgi:putative endonuclease|nr:MAG: GIY-YIG nuclease family protein [Gammaproteobacteria bacterium HGW-Gammaproteobacteria-4]
MAWYVYLLQCRDGSLYTGITVDVQRRFAQHAAGKGARYTRAHPPQRIVAVIEHTDRSSATRAEAAIKRLSPEQKRALCATRTRDAHPGRPQGGLLQK